MKTSQKIEQAKAKAQAVLDADNPSLEEILAADRELRGANLSDLDPFWVRWGYLLWTKERKGKIRRGSRFWEIV